MAKSIDKHIELLESFKIFFLLSLGERKQTWFLKGFDNSNGTCKYTSHRALSFKLNKKRVSPKPHFKFL